MISTNIKYLYSFFSIYGNLYKNKFGINTSTYRIPILVLFKIVQYFFILITIKTYNYVSKILCGEILYGWSKYRIAKKNLKKNIEKCRRILLKNNGSKCIVQTTAKKRF